MKKLIKLMILIGFVGAALAPSPSAQACLLVFGDAEQLKEEKAGLNAFPNYVHELERAIRIEASYRPLGEPQNRLQKIVFEHLLKQLGGRLLFSKPGTYRPIEVKAGMLHFEKTATSRQLTVVWSNSELVTAPSVSGDSDNIVITLPKNYIPGDRFETFLDAALVGHDLHRYTTSRRVQNERASEPKIILKPGQREALLEIAARDQATPANQSIALSIQAPPGYGKTLILTEALAMRIRRTLQNKSERNIHFVVTQHGIAAKQLADSIQAQAQLAISAPVDFELVRWDGAQGKSETANMQALTKRSRELANQNKALVVSVTWNFLASQVGKLSNLATDLKAFKKRLNGVYIDEASQTSLEKYRDTVATLFKDNGGTLLLGIDAEFLDPKVRDVLFKNELFDVYRKQIPPSNADPAQVIITHIRVGSARGEITPIVDDETNRVVYHLHPKEILDPIRERGVEVSDGVFYDTIHDTTLRAEAFGALVPHLAKTLREHTGRIRVNTIGLAEQLAAYLNEYCKAHGIPKRVAAFHSDSVNKEEILANWKNPDAPADKKIDWLISPKLLDQSVDAPHISSIIIINEDMDKQNFLEVIGRAARLYPGKQRAHIVHVTRNPIFHEELLAGLRKKQSELEEDEKEKTPKKGGGEAPPPLPYDTQVDFVNLSTSDEWFQGHLVPVFPVGIADIGDLTKMRQEVLAAFTEISDAARAFLRGEIDRATYILRTKAAILTIDRIYGDIEAQGSVGFRGLFNGSEAIAKVVEEGLGNWQKEFLSTRDPHQVADFLDSMGGSLFAHFETLRLSLEHMEPELANGILAQTLEMGLTASMNYRQKVRSSWPISEQEAKLRLQRLATVWNSEVWSSGEDRLEKLTLAINEISKVLVSITALGRKIELAVQAGDPIAQNNLEALVEKCLGDFEKVLLALNAIFRNDAVFPILLRQFHYLRHHLKANLLAGDAHLMTTFFNLTHESYMGTYPLQSCLVFLAGKVLHYHPLQRQSHLLDEFLQLAKELFAIPRGKRSPAGVARFNELVPQVQKLSTQLGIQRPDLSSLDAPMAMLQGFDYAKWHKRIVDWFLDFSRHDVAYNDLLIKVGPDLLVLLDEGKSQAWLYNYYKNYVHPDLPDVLNVSPSPEGLTIKGNWMTKDTAVGLRLLEGLSTLVFDPNEVPDSQRMFSALYPFLGEKTSTEIKTIHDQVLKEFLYFWLSRTALHGHLRQLSTNMIHPHGMWAWYKEIVSISYMLIVMQKTLPPEERMMPVEEYIAVIQALLQKIEAQMEPIGEGKKFPRDAYQFDLSLPKLPQAESFSSFANKPSLDQMETNALVLLSEVLKDYRETLNEEVTKGMTFPSLNLKYVFRENGLDNWLSSAPPNHPDFYNEQRKRTVRMLEKVRKELHRRDPRKYPLPRN